jgi:hypothetical protein
LRQGCGGAGGGAVAGAADDRHGASLCAVSGGIRAQAEPRTTERAEVQTAPAHRGFVDSVIVLITLCCGPVSGLTRGAGVSLDRQASPSHAVMGTVDLTLRSLTVAGAAPD